MADFSYPLTQNELDNLEYTILDNSVIVKLAGETIYHGDCVSLTGKKDIE